jgi:hypothetical protein
MERNMSRKVTVYRRTDSKKAHTKDLLEQVDSVAMTENNTLVVYRNGEPYRIYHPSIWLQVESEENRVHSLD